MNILNDFNYFIKNPQMYKFLIVGIVVALFVLSLTIFLTSTFNIHYTISVAISLEIGVIWSFFVHDRWTFSNVQKTTNTKSRFVKYNTIAMAGLGVNEVILVFFTTQINLHYSISEAIAIFFTFFFNYFLQKKVSWKN